MNSPLPSALLSLPGAVAGDGVDALVAAHYGSFNVEQRALENGEGFVDLSHRDVVRVEHGFLVDIAHLTIFGEHTPSCPEPPPEGAEGAHHDDHQH